jgi:DNA-directed RNA polymerase specialized sigma24 family protein
MIPALDPYVLQQVSCRASLLVATAGFRSDYRDDLRQDLILDCLRRSAKFDPNRGDWQGFVRGVVRNHATVLATRRYRRVQQEVLAEDWFNDDQSALEYLRSYDPADHIHLRLDVARVVSQLAPQLQTLALLLTVVSIGEVPAAIGKSRSRVYQMIRQIRVAFINAGLAPAASRRTRRHAAIRNTP